MGLVQQGNVSLALFNRVFWVVVWFFFAWFMGLWPLANIIQGDYIIIMATGLIMQGETLMSLQQKTSCPKIKTLMRESLLKNTYEQYQRFEYLAPLQALGQTFCDRQTFFIPFWISW